jgi:hypothetical protein
VASKKDIENAFDGKRLVYSLLIYRRRVKTDVKGGITYKNVELFSRQKIDINEIVIIDENIHKNVMCGYKITVVKQTKIQQQQLQPQPQLQNEPQPQHLPQHQPLPHQQQQHLQQPQLQHRPQKQEQKRQHLQQQPP